MIFKKGYIYHIYNHGNNHRKIFLSHANYLYFLGKVKNHLLPFADLLAWCLMPNHFHFMVLVKNLDSQGMISRESQGMTSNHTLTETSKDSQGFTQSETLITSSASETLTKCSLNDSIGIMLRSYTRAINKQQGTSGSLFRKETKAECINCPKGITPSFITKSGITQINIKNPEQQYPQVCFGYIHQNPVKAGLVKHATDWEFSSARDYAGLRDGKLVNKKAAAEYVKTG
jgi:putative transposase